MAVIKCSNCENEILDTEIVCPYCDCPVSKSVSKAKDEDTAAYSVKPADDAAPAEKKEEVPVATSFDFAKEKAAILRDLGIKDPSVSSEADRENDVKPAPAHDAETGIDKTVIDVPMEETVKISRDAQEIKPVAPKAPDSNRPPVRKPGEAPRNGARKPGDPTRPPVRKPVPPRAPAKKAKKKSSASKYVVLAVTIIGIAVVIYLIWGIAGSISTNINKTKKTNKIVKVVDSAANSDADAGFELHSSTLTITSDDVMTDYDSPQDTPWYEHKDKIKHVTFGKDVTRIGAHAFEGFENITDINISDSVEFIGESAFCNCTELVKITNMSKNIEEIDDYAFTGCKNLSKIPGYTEEADFEPALERIGVEAFKSCKSLPAFKVASYTQIDTDAFYGHGADFAIVCRRSSEAYEYAAEKGIPTKTSFDAEETETAEIEYIPAAPVSTTTKTETKKDITRNETEEGDGEKSDTKKDDAESTDTTTTVAPETTAPSTAPSTVPSTGNTTAPSTAPVAGSVDNSAPPAGSVGTGVYTPGQTPAPSGNVPNAGVATPGQVYDIPLSDLPVIG